MGRKLKLLTFPKLLMRVVKIHLTKEQWRDRNELCLKVYLAGAALVLYQIEWM